jgi:hypothetical protein
MFLMLARLEIVADEPVAAPAPVLDKAAIDRREISRKVVKFWPVIRDYLVDRSGRSLVRHLDPKYVTDDPNRGRPYGVPDPRPQLRELRGPMPWLADGTTGSWMDVGTGKRGDDPISLVEYLGQCDRKTATTFLKELTDRMVELPK